MCSLFMLACLAQRKMSYSSRVPIFCTSPPRNSEEAPQCCDKSLASSHCVNGASNLEVGAKGEGKGEIVGGSSTDTLTGLVGRTGAGLLRGGKG